MRNIPVFTTESGVASLVLEEIPYKKEAYIRIHSAESPREFLQECVDFCKAVGAENIFATGHGFLNVFPVHTQLVRMRCKGDMLSSSDLELRSVNEDTLPLWCDLYNTNMRNVPNASTMVASKVRGLLKSKNCCLVYEDQQLVGIGMTSSEQVDAIVSLIPGKGTEIMRALCKSLTGEYVNVEVASNNTAAVKLYRKLGFTEVETIAIWHCVHKI